MKHIKLIIAACVIIVGAGIIYSFSYTQYTPVLVERSEFEASIASMPVQELKNPGKIFVRSNLLFVVEKYYGVHVINNMNPANPQKIGFIRILGCTEVTVKNNTMYASSAVDLVVIDISDIQNVHEVNRIQNVFPELTSPSGEGDWKFSDGQRPENTVIIAWNKK
ncbi:MAG TPA: hypothetical protein PK199_07820 [Bacteroidales bacterium]|nr:hypothetical protein [Bacteroidales bacterium]